MNDIQDCRLTISFMLVRFWLVFISILRNNWTTVHPLLCLIAAEKEMPLSVLFTLSTNHLYDR